MPLNDKLKQRLPLIIAIACGVLAILLFNIYMSNKEADMLARLKQAQRAQQEKQAKVVKSQEPTKEVLFAKRNIPPNTPITVNHVAIKAIPEQYAQPGAADSPTQVIGQAAPMLIAAGEQILITKLMPPGKMGNTLSEVTPEGKRAVTITLDRNSDIAGLIKPGDYVDVFGLISPPPGSQWPGASKDAPRLVSLFQGVTVLAVGEELMSPVGVSVKEEAKKKASSSRAQATVTLALNPQEAILLSFVQEHGSIKLVLRSSEDAQLQESVKSVDWDTLFQYLYPGAGRRLDTGEPPSQVEIYRGFKREVVPVTE